MSKRKPIIAIDGPAGSGKSTLGKAVANKLGFLYIDSGAMYRAFGLKCLRKNVERNDLDRISSLLKSTDIELIEKDGKLSILLDGKDVTSDIRTPEAGRAASIFAAIPIVRERMIYLQRRMSEKGGIVMDGRDIGTVVFPDADLKIFLEAGAQIRSIRRYKELYNRKPDLKSNKFEEILNQQKARDMSDRERSASPLLPADDAVIIDSTTMDKQEVLEYTLKLASELTD